MDEDIETQTDPDPEAQQPPDAEQPLDEWGNPEGTEYDAEGNALEPEPEDVPPAEPEPEQSAPAAPQVTFDSSESAEEAALRAEVGDDLFNKIMAAQDRRSARSQESMFVAQAHVTQAAVDNPELFRAYGPQIQQTLAKLPANVRATPQGVHVAVANLLLEEANREGLGKAIAKLAALSTGTAASKEKPRKEPIPAAQRPPSPSNRGSATPQLSPRENRIRLLVRDSGLSRDEAEAMVLGGHV